MKYRFLPNIATADLAFEAFGRDYNELFENAGLALESAMVDLISLKAREVKEIKLEGENLEALLSSFLEELVFIKDSEQLLFNNILCDVKQMGGGRWRVDAKLGGEKIDRKKHKLGVDVKAVTKHLFKIEVRPDKTYHCQVILDV
ncbi:hypothetical protein A2865_03150 [Candidatus Woesebacteria bacterium RIFCSPHIGHO2_01_FULL_39_17]|uniref:Protein archease n=3 Tax=Candidatus Woeseibacteriota TaxID=1752722 RepID=A0A0G0NL46_9BACT|nr:MAG: hypothetical protein US72_C0010G0007 [Microgenomates group bacterium GW2011_GWC1_38_12]KKQ94097.1 MAG: Protein archease [Candidatus Woesebacteria bacterium GW2011_GWB1_39_10b]KKR13556.1 MAG: Protein archease [Candidatus Woesebacteria bacterium GW2011_GWA1_39_21b]OGM22559.1 MAG: hypothetical protein A2865_03150 [Candidatus Woesebacteria bacterium RIFCSPHIGHO2_01_FULL_39_17]OGM63682.1 MAG: hypothetical protein A3A52_02565 [Candidatus Woesebacteria bacterium RIFCSPLOWO2_01_FULL_39_14]